MVTQINKQEIISRRTDRILWLFNQHPFNGIVRANLASFCGKSESYISMIFTRKKPPSIDFLNHIVAYINTNYSEYLSFPITIQWLSSQYHDTTILKKILIETDPDFYPIKLKANSEAKLKKLIDTLRGSRSYNQFFIGLGYAKEVGSHYGTKLKQEDIPTIEILYKICKKYPEVNPWFVLHKDTQMFFSQKQKP